MIRASAAACSGLVFAAAIIDCGSQYSVDPSAGDGGTSDASGVISDGQSAPSDGAADGASSSTQPDGSTNVTPDGSTFSSCIDAGVTPTGIDLKGLAVRGSAVFDLNSDGWLTLTDALNSKAGAAWVTTQYPILTSYTATFTLRVGPGNPYGEGITFAVLESNDIPGVGSTNNGSYGLQGIGLPGYAVVVDMYKNAADLTDDDVTTLKLVSMPDLGVIAHAGCANMLNDGAAHQVDISLTGKQLHVTLHGPTCTTDIKSSNIAFIRAAPVFFGFTGGTGTVSSSHNEIESATITSACR